jgi:hypothetical protein
MLYAAHRTGLLQGAGPLLNSRDIQTPLKATIIVRQNFSTGYCYKHALLENVLKC